MLLGHNCLSSSGPCESIFHILCYCGLKSLMKSSFVQVVTRYSLAFRTDSNIILFYLFFNLIFCMTYVVRKWVMFWWSLSEIFLHMVPDRKCTVKYFSSATVITNENLTFSQMFLKFLNISKGLSQRPQTWKVWGTICHKLTFIALKFHKMKGVLSFFMLIQTLLIFKNPLKNITIRLNCFKIYFLVCFCIMNLQSLLL